MVSELSHKRTQQTKNRWNTATVKLQPSTLTFGSDHLQIPYFCKKKLVFLKCSYAKYFDEKNKKCKYAKLYIIYLGEGIFIGNEGLEHRRDSILNLRGEIGIGGSLASLKEMIYNRVRIGKLFH